MIDLRSDTLTLPTKEMLETILSAPLGDDGRLNANGRGEDPTVNKLEDKASHMVGKEAGLLCPSGTMGNQAAVLTWCQPGDTALINDMQHLDVSEKTAFQPPLGQLNKKTYSLDENYQPRLNQIENVLKEGGISLICIENTHNYSGGTCITIDTMKQLHDVAAMYGVPIHMDGARLFNASLFLDVPASEICQYVDSVQFCFSKGLGAPVGSILCGTTEFIHKAKQTRKLLGGAMRQAGIIAAPALYALEHNISRLKEDHENCAYCAQLLGTLKKVRVQEKVETNILMLDMKDAGISPQKFCDMARDKGLLIRPIIDTWVRLVFYKGITKKDAAGAAQIIKDIDAVL